MEDEERIIVNGKWYRYNAHYERLELIKISKLPDDKEEIACPKCHKTEFSISYGSYECIANCKCGHSMVIYDG